MWLVTSFPSAGWNYSAALFQMLGGYGDFLYQTGMIDELQRDYVDQQTSLGAKLIQQQKWMEAFEVNSYLIASTLLLLDVFFFPLLLVKFLKSLLVPCLLAVGVFLWVFSLWFQVFDSLMNGDITSVPSFYQNATGCTNYYNYLMCQVQCQQRSKPPTWLHRALIVKISL